ncbi:MAG: hypothetical protein NT019_03515 [Candidatus Adlerbacteria bacterium]|nr:hypothetical protein [Candidatus Adlerbacteria bacterium]
MSQLYYQLLLETGHDEDINYEGWFRKPSDLPFPSPMGTSLDVPLFGDDLCVCTYSHDKGALYMWLGTPGMTSGESTFRLRVVNLAEAREELLDEGWEEMDKNDEPIKQPE